MLTLAIENSSPLSSIALMRGARRLARQEFRPGRRGQEEIFGLIADTLRRQGVEPEEIGRYVFGRGPGNYTGMRIALTLAQGMALPGGDELLAVSSGAALAADLLSEDDVGRVAVFGDARRDSYWASVFDDDDGLPRPEFDWRLCSAAELCGMLKDVDLAATSEFKRISARNDMEREGFRRVIKEDRFPRAVKLAEIALKRAERGIEPEPLQPLYLHPPV